MRKLLEETVKGQQIQNFVLNNWEAIELLCLDESIDFPNFTIPTKTTSLSASKMRDWLYKYQSKLHLLLGALFEQGTSAASHNLGTLISLKHVASKVDRLRELSKAVIALSEDSFGLLDTFHEDFKSLANTDPDYKELVDIESELLAPSKDSINYRHVFSKEDISATYSSEGSFTVVHIPIGDQLRGQTDIIANQVYQQNTSPVSLKLRIYSPDDDHDYRLIDLQFPVNNGIEQMNINVRYKDGTEKVLTNDTSFNDNRVTVIAEGNIDYATINLISTKPDGLDDNGQYHLFLVDKISFSVISPAQRYTFISTPISFPSEPKFRATYLTAKFGSPEGAEPSFFVSGKDNLGKWSTWRSINPNGKQKIRLGATNSETNTRTQDGMLLKPYISERIATVNWSISDCFSPIFGKLAHTTETNTLDVSSVRVLRDANTLSTPSTNGNNPGWKFEDDCWSTYINISTPVIVDFGSSLVEIDGVVISGTKELLAGIHHLKTTPDYWKYVPSGLNESSFKNEDSLFPYNVRYIVSGYKLIKEYPGLGIHGATLCRYVAPEIIKFMDYNEKFFSFDQDGTTLKPIVPILEDDNLFNKEFVAIWCNTLSNSEYYDKLKVKIEFETTSVVGSYVRSYTVMVV